MRGLTGCGKTVDWPFIGAGPKGGHVVLVLSSSFMETHGIDVLQGFFAMQRVFSMPSRPFNGMKEAGKLNRTVS